MDHINLFSRVETQTTGSHWTPLDQCRSDI